MMDSSWCSVRPGLVACIAWEGGREGEREGGREGRREGERENLSRCVLTEAVN